MQRLAINSKTLALTVAIIFNILISWVFAQLINNFSPKKTSVYTIYFLPLKTQNNQDTKIIIKHTQRDNILANAIEQTTKGKSQSFSKPLLAKKTKKTTQNNDIQTNQSKKQDISDSMHQTINNNLPNSKGNINDTLTFKQHSAPFNSQSNPIDLNYYPQILSWVEKHKFYPQEAIFKGEEGKIKLTFFIDRSGYLKNIYILEKSPYDCLNKAAIKIINKSSPLPNALTANINLPAYAKINIVFRLE